MLGYLRRGCATEGERDSITLSFANPLGWLEYTDYCSCESGDG